MTEGNVMTHALASEDHVPHDVRHWEIKSDGSIGT